MNPAEPIQGLAAIVALRHELDELESRHVADAIGEGRPWSQVAGALGISKQAAHKRHAARLREAPERPQPAPQRRLLVTGQARRVVERAREEAHAAGSDEVRPEHLLLGLLRDDHGTALRALEASGVRLGAARASLPSEGGGSSKAAARGAEPARVRVSSAARETLEQSLREAVRLGDSHLGVEHLLLALVNDASTPAARLLAELGVPHDQVARRVYQLVGAPG